MKELKKGGVVFQRLQRIMLGIAFAATTMVQAESLIQPGERVAIIGNTFADQLRVHGYLETLLLQRSKENPVSVRNFGWAGDTVTQRDRPTNFPSEDSFLKGHKTDVIVACFGMGESFTGKKGLADFRKRLKSLITSYRGKTYNGKSKVRFILVSPIAHENLGKLTPGWDRRNRELQAYTRVMEEVAKEQGVSFVNLYDPFQRLLEKVETGKLTTNGIHLTPYGYWSLSRILADALMEKIQPWKLQIDVRAQTAKADGVKISDVSRVGNSIRFNVEEERWPSMKPPARDHAKLVKNRDALAIDHLAPGEYQLLIDGKLVAKASHEAWAKGVAIDATPAHLLVDQFRLGVNDKNQQFVYSWKALNQVHIVGKRRASPSGKALPGEVVEFHKLAKQREEALRRGIVLKTREWKLVPYSPSPALP